MESLKRQ